MKVCRYCRHSEARNIRWEGRGSKSLVCWHHEAAVQPEDTCDSFKRDPGADDDLGDEG